MGKMVLDEDFGGACYDERLRWRCPPFRWSIGQSQLVVFPDAETDFWQRTHYGFCADNGHFLGLPIEGNFVLSTKVRFFAVHQYDQAGLMVRFSSEFWLKTSVEYEPEGPCRLGAVVTQDGYSDWSTQNFPADRNELELRVRKAGNDFAVDYREPGLVGTDSSSSSWTQIRLAHLEYTEGMSILAGLYACSPKASGLRAEFGFLRVEEA
jgi:hypothetical protein